MWNKILVVCIVSFIIFSGCAVSNNSIYGKIRDSTENTLRKNIVLFVIDGCRPDYFDRANIPNIRKLMENGTEYSDAWVGGLRSVSASAHTMLGTGSFAKNNGVLCHFQKDSETLQFMWNTDFDDVTSGKFYERLERMNVTSLSKEYKKRYPDSTTISIASGRFFAAAGMGYGADFVLFNDSWNNSFMSGKEYKVYNIGSNAFSDMVVKGNDDDNWATNLALTVVDKYDPDVLLINLNNVDLVGHTTKINSDDTVCRALENADFQIGRVMDAYKQNDKYDDTIWVIMSDHGMIPCLHWISQSDINNFAKDNSAMITPNSEAYIAQYDESKMSPTGIFDAISSNNANGVANDIVNADIPGVKGVYYKTSDNKYVLLSKTVFSGDFDKCLQYLLSTSASNFSHDIILVCKENWHLDSYKTFPQFIDGSHDSISWNTQHTVLIISGPNVKEGKVLDSPARIVDISPTLLYLSGAISSNVMDGIVLADCMKITNDEYAKQNNINGQLRSLTKIMKDESKRDLMDNMEEFGGVER
jgi:predicted AlkP superfamily pyrophosphatase or phosphodiesterase